MTVIDVIGAGLAGSEAALQLAKQGFKVRLHDIKPIKRSPAHHSDQFAEIVCSNSFGSQGDATASGLVKQEMEALGCELLKIAQSVAVPAGKALAVDRDAFSARVTKRIEAEPNITFIAGDVTQIPADADYVIIATGPLTTEGLVATFGQLLEREQLYFFDAASPIVTRDSINFDVAFYQDRYGGDSEEDVRSYINCPFDQPQYEALIEKILASEKTELKDFEKESASYFESCLPVEVIASRGPETLRFGPMKPVGLCDPRTGERPHAVVQLRQDNAEGTLYNIVGFQTNIKWGAQGEMIRMIPGLENAEIVRFGVMHRNTFIHSPEVLQPTLQLKKHPHILFAGQLTGTEGYTESIATGMMAALNVARLSGGKSAIVPPAPTMLGSLLRYITREEAVGRAFQPINSNWGILPEASELTHKERKNKRNRNAFYVSRSLKALQDWGDAEGVALQQKAGV